ncbi:hypothetical protein [Parasulfitobacter algicola]|uniref:PH domain-containing protein n=1 Tax=Parasulfitobacter algicola TaxID=2614809 RepID=A0ABX2IUB4_9RHOB|nr:hypothetical protein [Sulfitobacter algicola]NSX56493.1 hypothetical protein [Sulfitobacter algicola]
MADPYRFKDTITPFDPDLKFWQKHLVPGETIIWEGRPNFSFKLDKTALGLAIPGFVASAVLFIINNDLLGASGPGQLVLSPTITQQINWGIFIAIVYLVLYLLYHSMTQSRLTRYALTNKRALIHNRLPWPKLNAKYLTPMSEVAWDQSDPGSIVLGQSITQYRSNAIFRSGIVKERKEGFLNIDNPQKVYDLMQRVVNDKV